MGGTALGRIVSVTLTQSRQLDRGNAQPASLGADFGRFRLDLWPAANELDARTPDRARRLEQLVTWRNAIVHQDFNFTQHERDVLGDMTRMGLREVRACRSACDRLAATLDEVLARHLESIVGALPW